MTKSIDTSINFNDKSLLYKLCNFLYKKRIETKGIKTPVKISKNDFMTVLSDYAHGANDIKNWELIWEELENLIKYEENDKSQKLISFQNRQITKKSKFLTFIYKSEDMDFYIKKLKGLKEPKIIDPVDKFKIIFKDSAGDYYLNTGNSSRLLKLNKSKMYYEAFDTIYSLAPEGGTILFTDFAGIVSSRIKRKLANKDDNGKCKIIRSYVTDKSNGFLRASKIKDATFKGKPLIECKPGIGITFNNKK